MSLFNDLFNADGNDVLPDWLQSGAAALDEGLDLYDRIAGGGAQPQPTPILVQAPSTGLGWKGNTGIILIGAAVLLLFLANRK